jgi:CBS-domain-containing membrane protein
MTASVDSIEAAETIAYAARRMAEDDVGALPILNDGKLVGIVTDRDIAVRGVAAGISPEASVGRVMSENVAACSPDDDIETVLALMSREQIRRMPVCDSNNKVVGIITLADLAEHDPDKQEVTEALADICEPSGLHCQAPSPFARGAGSPS